MTDLIDRTDLRPKSRQRPRRTRFWVASSAMLAAGLILAGTQYYRQDLAPPVAPPPAPAIVSVSPPLQRVLDRRQGFLGQFAAVETVELRAQVGGTLTGIGFKDGAIVQKGDLLFTIDPRPYAIKHAEAVAALETAQAKLVLTTRELSRARELKKSDFGTAENVDQRESDQRAAEAALDSAKAALDDADFDLEHCRVTAPFTGRIGAHQVSLGALIAGSRAAASPTTLLTTLVSLDPIHLNFDMAESDYQAFLKAKTGTDGQKVAIALADETGFPHTGVLDFVDNALDAGSGTIRARATVPNPDLRLTPGEFARLELSLSPPAPTLLLPDSVIQPDQSRHIVLTVAPDNTVQTKPIELGELRDGLRVIRAGLTPTDRVIVAGQLTTGPGAKVTVRDGAIQPALSQN